MRNTPVTRNFIKDIDAILTDKYGERYKLYRKLWNHASPDEIPNFPVHLDFELIDACNMRCPFCPRCKETHPNMPYEVNTGKILDEGIIDKIINEARQEKLFSISFGYGEPLLNTNIFSIIKRFHDVGVIDSRVVTNGTLVDKHIDSIFNSGLVNLFFSVDAVSEGTYKKQRGKYFQQVKENIFLLLKEREKRKSIFPFIRVSFVINELNEHEKDEFISYWQDKVDLIDVQDLTDYRKLKPFTEKKRWNCVEPFRRLAVTSDNMVLPCCVYNGKMLPVGNIQKQSIKEIWNSVELNKLRSMLLADEIDVCLACQQC